MADFPLLPIPNPVRDRQASRNREPDRATHGPTSAASVPRHPFQPTLERLFGRHASGDEQSQNARFRKPCVQKRRHGAEVSARRQDVVNDGQEIRGRFGQRVVDSVTARDLFGRRPRIDGMSGFGAFGLNDQLANIRWRRRIHRPQHPHHSVVVEPVALRLGWWNRNERESANLLRAQGGGEYRRHLTNRPFLVLPFVRIIAPIHRFLEI